jgi:hypothetical protein
VDKREKSLTMSREFRDETGELASVSVQSQEAEAVTLVEAELETIFGSSGKQVLLREFSTRYSVTV